MSIIKRHIISLPKRDEKQVIEEPTVVLDFFDVLIPCRKFRINYKVAEKGAVSVTSEFVLRLLYSVEGMDEVSISEFFGFDQREMSFVMDEVITRDYVLRNEGHVWLTDTGRSLFKGGSKTPHIYSVEKRSDIVGFDLLSLCPQEFESISRLDMQLPELTVPDADLVASATKRVPDSFRRHFTEIGIRRKGNFSDGQQYLYSVDSVEPEQKFFSVIQVMVTAKGGRPASAEVDLTRWRLGHELEDREVISGVISKYLNNLKQSKRVQDAWAYDRLAQLAPEFLSDFIRPDGFSVDRFHKSAVARVGDLRADRPTIPLLGSLFTPNNNEKLLSALDYAMRRSNNDSDLPEKIHWLIPSLHWGFTRILPATLAALKRRMANVDQENHEPREVGFSAWHQRGAKLSRFIEEAFTEFHILNNQTRPVVNLEILWIPGLVVAVLVHAPIKSDYSLPAPLGILSFDPQVVARANDIFQG